MKTLLATIMIAMLCSACSGCGSTNGGTRSAAGAPAARTAGVPASSAASSPVDLSSLEQDEDDDDDPGEEKGLDSKDPDIDGDNDHLKPLGYYDHDDGAIRAYGHAASMQDTRDLAAFVTRYFTAAGAEDGATACSMLTPVVAEATLKAYGRGSSGGPSYLREATTCPAVLTLLFKSLHSQLRAPVQIILVRVDGEEARVLFSASKVPASYLEAHREGDGWRSVEILATPLP